MENWVGLEANDTIGTYDLIQRDTAYDTCVFCLGILTDEPDMQEIIRKYPGLLWKALNVRKHRRRPEEEREI